MTKEQYMRVSKVLSVLPLIASASLAGRTVYAQQVTPAEAAAAARANAEQNQQVQQQHEAQERAKTVNALRLRRR